MAPLPGPHPPVAPPATPAPPSLVQKKDIRGPSTDGPTSGVYQWHVPPPTPAPLPGPHPGMGPSFNVKHDDQKTLA